MPKAKSLVVGVDGSPESQRAAAVGWWIAERTGWRLYPVYAVPDFPATPLIPDLWRGARVGGFRTGSRSARARVERMLRAIVPASGAQVSLIARPGRAPIVITDAARRLGASLIVVGGAPGSRTRTAQYLVRRGAASVMVARSARPIRRVLVAIDGGAGSPAVLRAAAKYARLFGAGLRAVHVLEQPRSSKSRTAESLQRLLSHNGGIDGSVRQASSAGAGITAESAKQRADLVVVAARRRGLIDRLLLGSTTEQLLAELPASLLVIPSLRR